MRYLAIVLSVLMLVACGAGEIKRAMYADCRLQGFEQGTQQFNDCVKVGMYNAKMQYLMSRQAATGQAMQSIGSSLMRQQPMPMPAPKVAPRTQFCYPGQGFTYCQ